MEGCDKVLVSVDWFSLSCHLVKIDAKPKLPDNWKAQEMGRTAVWSNRVYVMNPEGVKVGTILMKPISPMIKEDRAVVEVSNVFLYREEFHTMLDILISCYGLVVDGVQRCDLCGDFEMNENRWEVVKMLEDGRAYLKALKRGVIWWTGDKKNRVPHQLSWGGKDSSFKWKLYNKHKEIWEGGMCSKPYIEEMWKSKGLTPSKVWRLEVSMSALNKLQCDGLGIGYYREWYDYSHEIYRALYADKFVIRENQGHADRRNDDVVFFLDLYGGKMVRHRKPKYSEIESDVQRRIVCKLWKEFSDGEVRCDDFAMSGLRDALSWFFQRESNVMAVARRFKITMGDVLKQMSCLPV